MTEDERRELSVNRWRLVLGSQSDRDLEFSGTPSELRAFADMEDLLDYLYSRSSGDDVREEGSRSGGRGDSTLSAAKWINKVRELFPNKTADVLEKHALDEFHLTELLTDKEVLEKMTPNMDLLKTIMQLRHLMKGEVLETAKRIAAKVADELREKLENSVRQSILGRIDRNSSSPVHTARNLDFKKTIRRNLKNYDSESGQLMLKEIYFSNRVKRYSNKTVIIAVDESGSMVGSVIYSAVMAQIISKLPFAEVKLVIFDTNIVDLTGQAEDPAEVLMSVQLGGGTDIGKAMCYCEKLITAPSQTVVICVTDLYEGGPVNTLMNVSRNIITSGAKLSYLTALDENANAAFDRNLGQRLADMGAFVGALTPDQLGDYVGRIFSGG
ncbi:VWA domain-containing protein [Ruminococcus albus]|uniref:VWA domain containing CoxE-like protein n=1 Tax=Ruminococcus albus TaxID=1264 RepID=A0A1I1CYG7_RUMAL|nr:VWA domain-containing protein [Ruminococcus albus]SFB67086.1 VWA domain containing CoxE-like protein [Ruminococcus albus]